MQKDMVSKNLRLTQEQYEMVIGLAERFELNETATIRKCITAMDAILNDRAKVVLDDNGNKTVVIL